MFVASKQSILALGGGAFKLSARDRSIDRRLASQPANGSYTRVAQQMDFIVLYTQW